jgi:hypothetical protein
MQNISDPNAERTAVRPFFRVLGALLTGFVTYIYVEAAIPLFTADHAPAMRCTETRWRRQLLCDFDRWVMSGLADGVQGPVRAVGCLLFAAVWAYATWWLLYPMLIRRR